MHLVNSDAFAQSLHYGTLAGFAAFARALFDSAHGDSPDVVSLAVRITADAGQSVIECEYIDAQGHAVGGFGL